MIPGCHSIAIIFTMSFCKNLVMIDSKLLKPILKNSSSILSLITENKLYFEYLFFLFFIILIFYSLYWKKIYYGYYYTWFELFFLLKLRGSNFEIQLLINLHMIWSNPK